MNASQTSIIFQPGPILFTFKESNLPIRPVFSFGPKFITAPNLRTAWNIEQILFSWESIVVKWRASTEFIKQAGKFIKLEFVVMVNGIPTFLSLLKAKTPTLEKEAIPAEHEETLFDAQSRILEPFNASIIDKCSPMYFQAALKEGYVVPGFIPNKTGEISIQVNNPQLTILLNQSFSSR